MVGDAQVPLLRIVPVEGRDDVQQRRIDKTMTNSERKRRRTTKKDRQDNDKQ